MNLCMIVAYDGSAFAGWQKNKNTGVKRALQDILEELLSGYFRQEIRVQAAGRTDAGVNAAGQVLNFHVRWKGGTEVLLKELRSALAAMLSSGERDAVIIKALYQVPEHFHSRFDAVGKTYEYFFDEEEKAGVFDRRYAYPAGGRLNLSAMRKAAEYLAGEHDFRAFSSLRQETARDTVRRITEIRIDEIPRKYSKGTLLRLSFTGDGFLYHMVRILAGTLLEVGQGVRTPESVQMLLCGGKRSEAGPLLYAEPLFLKEVYYSEKTGGRNA